MSAFLVSAKCIDRVIIVLRSFERTRRTMWSDFQRANCPPGLALGDKDMLGMYLIELNRRAVGDPIKVAPYTYHEPDDDTGWDAKNFGGPMQCYKSLRCYLYQCAGGNDPLLIHLRWIEKQMAKMFGHRPDGTFLNPNDKAAYDAATWG